MSSQIKAPGRGWPGLAHALGELKLIPLGHRAHKGDPNLQKETSENGYIISGLENLPSRLIDRQFNSSESQSVKEERNNDGLSFWLLHFQYRKEDYDNYFN